MIVFLTGYMASGKTTLGRSVSVAGAADYIDLDEYIAEISSQTPGEWFERHGEEAFRKAERAALEKLACEGELSGRPLIIGCGGGTPCHSDNIDFMKARGRVVWLDAGRQRILERLAAGASTRPLVSGMSGSELESFVDRHFEARRKYYEAADIKFDSTYLDTELEIEATTKRFIDEIILRKKVTP